MKKILSSFIMLFLVVLALIPAIARSQEFKVATGSKTGTYSRMLDEVNKYCSNVLPVVNQESSGSVENLSLLLDNQVSAAFVQTDVLYFKDRTDNIQGTVKTLLALHPEEVHLLAKNAPFQITTEEKGKFYGTTKKVTQVQLNSISDLAGRTVGAAGGSYITAQLIRLQSEVTFQVRQYETSDQVKQAIDSGEIAAGIFVGGQPYPMIGGDQAKKIAPLGPEYKLLPIDGSAADKLKSIYRSASLKYPKMTANSVKTVATDALLVTGDYKSPRMVAQLRAFHDCVLEHLLDFQETTGFHAKWRSVDPANFGKWPSRYEFQAVQPVKQVKSKKK